MDNRYQEQTSDLGQYLSDFGINKIRCEIEIKYFIMLIDKILKLDLVLSERKFIEQYYENFTYVDFIQIKNIEKKDKSLY